MTPHATITEDLIKQEQQHCISHEFTLTESRSYCSCRAPRNWLLDVWKQLQAIESLPDGWDSYGAPAPDSKKMRAAFDLIYSLRDCPYLPKPHVNPTRDGGVQFEWEAGSRYFEIEIVGERAATYLFCDDTEHIEETGELFEDESLDSVLDFINRVGGGD